MLQNSFGKPHENILRIKEIAHTKKEEAAAFLTKMSTGQLAMLSLNEAQKINIHFHFDNPLSVVCYHNFKSQNIHFAHCLDDLYLELNLWQ